VQVLTATATGHCAALQADHFPATRLSNSMARPPPSRYRPDLPLWLERVRLKAVTRDPADRFETAEAVRLA